MTLHPVGAISSAANPLVSIVWFGKNRLQWVEKEVGGILRQDHANWQLVVEDSGSTDGTLEWFRGLAERDEQAARLVSLHCFAGLSVEQAAEVLAISARTAYRDWAFAQAWLYREIRDAEPPRE